jgi:hypothetical protein
LYQTGFLFTSIGIFLPLRQKLLKTLQNEAIFPQIAITRKTLIYPSLITVIKLRNSMSNLTFSQRFWPFCLLLFLLFLADDKVSDTEEKCYFGFGSCKNDTN